MCSNGDICVAMAPSIGLTFCLERWWVLYIFVSKPCLCEISPFLHIPPCSFVFLCLVSLVLVICNQSQVLGHGNIFVDDNLKHNKVPLTFFFHLAINCLSLSPVLF